MTLTLPLSPLTPSPFTLSPRSALAFPQSPPPRRLRALFDGVAGRRHTLHYVALRNKRMHDLGHTPAPALRDDLNTRMILLGRGWSLAHPQALGLLQGEAEAANGMMRRRV